MLKIGKRLLKHSSLFASLSFVFAGPLVVASCSSESSTPTEDEKTDSELDIKTYDEFSTEDMTYASSQSEEVVVGSDENSTLNINKYLPFEPTYIDVVKSNAQKRIVYKNEDETIFSINDFERARVKSANEVVKIIFGNTNVDDSTTKMNLNNLDIGNHIFKKVLPDSTTSIPIKTFLTNEKWFNEEKANIENKYIFARLGIDTPELFNVWQAMKEKNYTTRNGYNHGADTKGNKIVKTWANINYDAIKNTQFTYFDPKLYPEITTTGAYFQSVLKFGEWLGEDNVTTKKADSTNKHYNYLILSDDEDGIREGYTRTLNGKTQFAEKIDDFQEIEKFDIDTRFTPNARYYINTIDDEILSGEGASANKAPGWKFVRKEGADGSTFGFFMRDSAIGVKEYMSLNSISYQVSWKRNDFDSTATKHYFGVTTNREPEDEKSGRPNDNKAIDKIVGAFSSLSGSKPDLLFSSINLGIIEQSNEKSNNFLWFRNWHIPTSDAVFDADDTDKEFLYFFIDGKLVVSKRIVNPN